MTSTKTSRWSMVRITYVVSNQLQFIDMRNFNRHIMLYFRKNSKRTGGCSMNLYRKMEKHIQKALRPCLRSIDFDAAMKDIHKQFLLLAPQVPNIGGNINPFYSNMLNESVLGLALYKALKAHGIPVENIGQVLLDTFTYRMSTWPRLLRKFINWLLFSPFVKRILKRRAEISQRNDNPANWEMYYIDGLDGSFAYGIDYKQCAICKFFHIHDADEFTVYQCKLDFPMSNMLGWGLVRTKTIAEGHGVCDFRFNKEPVK